MSRIIVILLFALCSFFSAKAGLDTNSFHHFNLKNGLPSNNVYSTLQDRDGYIWFATDNGLVMYNGYTFQLFNTETAKLPSNDVFDLYEDKRGRLWIVSMSNTIGYIQNGMFKKIYYSGNERLLSVGGFSEYKGLVAFFVWRPASFDLLIVANDNVIKTASFKNDGFTRGKGDVVYNVTNAPDFNFYLWNQNRHIYSWNLNAVYPKYLGKMPEEFMYSYTKRFIVSPNLVTYSIRPHTDEFESLNMATLEYKKGYLKDLGAGSDERIFTVNPYFAGGNKQEYLALISNSHLYLLSQDLTLITRDKLTDIIPSNMQLAFRDPDRKNNTWYSTKGDGVWMKPGSFGFYANGRNEVPPKSNYAGSIGNSSFWWVSQSSELYEIEKGKIINVIKPGRNIEVWSVTGDSNRVFMSTPAGFFIYDRKTKIVRDLNSAYNVKYSSWFHIHYHNSEALKTALLNVDKIKMIDNTICGVASYGLLNLEINGDEVFVSYTEAERYLDFHYDEIRKDIYCYNSKRILIKNIPANTISVIAPNALAKLGIGNVRKLVTDKYGDVYILDNASLYRYDRKGKLTEIKTNFSLADAIIDINNDHFFIGGSAGLAIARITGKGRLSEFSIVPNMSMRHYSRAEQLIFHDNSNGILQTDARSISFHTDSLSRYIPASKNLFAIAVLQPFKRAIHHGDTLKLSQAESILKLDAINYYGKGNLRYVYRVSGSSEWTTSTSGEIFLSSLPADKYTKIECEVNDDLWESDVYTFYIYRYPLWWQTATWRTIFWVAGVVVFVLLVLMTVLITRYYVAKKNERRRALTELELQAIHSQINPHFIFNTLSAALFYISKKRFDDAYTHVNKFSQLLRSYLKSSHDRYVILEEEIKMLRTYIELQQIRFEEKFEYRIEIDNKLPINNVRIPSLLLQPLVENAINHGLFHREMGGILLLKFEQGADNTVLVCTIDDNGVGRVAARKINESSSARDSYGTTLTNQLLEVFKLYEKLDIKLDYTDKALPETGTVVTLTLKNIKYVA